MQRSIPCLFMRGGTSRGPFFLENDLPRGPGAADAVLLSVMGSPDARQIDGLGRRRPSHQQGGHCAAAARRAGVDLEFLFAQVSVKEARSTPRPIAATCWPRWSRSPWKRGWCRPAGDLTTLRVLTRNTGTLSDIEVRTPGGKVEYAGDARIDGVPGTAAPINISFSGDCRFGVRLAAADGTIA